MTESAKRDHALQNVAGNPSNNYPLILGAAEQWIARQRHGSYITAADVYHAVVDRYPQLDPPEKRVMGAVMRALSAAKWIGKPRYTKRSRSHMGDGKEWCITRFF